MGKNDGIMEHILEPEVFWEDLRFPATQTKTGSNLKPDFDESNVGLLFPQNNTAEKIYIVAQFPHAMKRGSSIRPHIHMISDEAEVPVFKMQYRWYDVGAEVPDWTTIETNGVMTDFESGDTALHQYLTFPEISGVGITGVSSLMDIIIYRDDNVVSGDVLFKEFDIHYQIDDPGSVSEFKKRQ